MRNGRSGFVHVKCPVGEGGLKSIEAGFSPSIDYGSSFLRRLTVDGDQISLSPRRLIFDETVDVGSRKSNLKRALVAAQDPRKCAKYYDSTESSPDEEGEYANEKRSAEQMAILNYEPEMGEVVVVNALAGCGKTTTIALLCDKIQKDHPGKECLYLVFNAKARNEAVESNKFPKLNMEIRTTHAYVKRHYFGDDHLKVKPTVDHKLEDIIDKLDLLRNCEHRFGDKFQGDKKRKTLERRAKTIAGFIRSTIKNFQASADRQLKENHVFWRAKRNSNLTSRNKWRGEIGPAQYVRWANEFFKIVLDTCVAVKNEGTGQEVKIPHDAYLKVAQLENLEMPYRYIFIDESQDMTACQADLFWGQHQRDGKNIYLFGDVYQQLYRFRGASQSFQKMVSSSKPKFTLSGSFRFGKNIAACATCILKASDRVEIYGRSNNDGIVEVIPGEAEDKKEEEEYDGKSREEEEDNVSGDENISDCDSGEEDEKGLYDEVENEAPNKGVVLCRSQNGMFRYLFANRPARWCYLDGGRRFPQAPERWKVDLETFLIQLENNEASQFRYRGEKFCSIENIEEYIDEEGDVDLHRALALAQYLVARHTSITDFHTSLKDSFVPLKDGESANDYNGIVLSTVHKAKGMEFSCPVVVSDDFCFSAIKSSVVSKDRRSDEANTLYVAITRAMGHLVLTPKVNDCLKFLSALEHVKVKLPCMYSLRASRKMYSTWKVAWDSFKDADGRDNVPLPPNWNDENYPLALHPAMSVPDQRKQLYRFLRAYHPDKFIPRFGKLVESEILETITRKCTYLLESLRDNDEN